jgi:hypothetical protein
MRWFSELRSGESRFGVEVFVAQNHLEVLGVVQAVDTMKAG